MLRFKNQNLQKTQTGVDSIRYHTNLFVSLLDHSAAALTLYTLVNAVIYNDSP